MTWTGTVTLVDFENPIQSGGMGGAMMMSGSGQGDEMTAASKYPFYVELDSTDGLLLGQHVYMEMDTGDGETPAVSVPAAFLMMEEDGSAQVWMEKGGKLTRQAVELGEMDPMTGTYAVVSGLTTEDYIAFPDANVCREGAPTTPDRPEPTEGQEGEEAPMEVMPDMGGEADMGGMEMPVEEMPVEEMPVEEMPEEVPAEETMEPNGGLGDEGQAADGVTDFYGGYFGGGYDPSAPSEGGV